MFELLQDSFGSGVQKHLMDLMKNGYYADMKFVIENDKEILMHKAIASLLLPSDFLNAGNEFRMSFVTQEIGQAISALIYTGRSVVSTKSGLEDFKRVAESLQFLDKVLINQTDDKSYVLKTASIAKFDFNTSLNSKPSTVKREWHDQDEWPMDDGFGSDNDENLPQGKPDGVSLSDYYDMEIYKYGFSCPECEAKTRTSSGLIKHFQEQHQGSDISKYEIDTTPYKCKYCTKSFGAPRNLKDHLKGHESSALDVPCTWPGCFEKFVNFTEKGKHVRKVHRKYQKAGKWKQNNLEGNRLSGKHLFRKSNQVSTECPACHDFFAGKYSLLEHYRTRHPDLDYDTFKAEIDEKLKLICKYCAKEFMKPESLLDHERTIHEDYNENILCGMCGDSFRTKDQERRHFYKVHGPNGLDKIPNVKRKGRKFLATSKKISYDKKVYNIYTTFDRERYFNMDTNECKLCGKVFKPDIMKLHWTRVHENTEKTHECEECDATFKTLWSLSQHIDFKHKEWTEMCAVCNKKIPNVQELTMHLKKQHNIQLMRECNICKLIFTNSKNYMHKKKCANSDPQCIMVRPN